MITVQKIINIDGHGLTNYAFDELTQFELLICDGMVIVMDNGKCRGEFSLRTILIDYTNGFMEFIREEDEDWFYNQILNVLHPSLARWFKPRPYNGERW
ncbi:hypothetical protein ACO1ZG_21800 [Enterobacter kobei]|uniref:hypothetical protein n=1 Tax=Enterobacter kobei TaxID=208224 RepID=UPI003B88D837